MRIILLGAPGAGKGTQAQLISNQLGIAHVCTGDMFRDNIARQTEIGKKAKAIMDSGNLVPDEVVIDMLMAALSEQVIDNGFVLDGFPRTIPQAEALASRLKVPIDRVIFIDTPQEVIVKRLGQRRICRNPACGSVYNLDSKPPKISHVCDICADTLVTRKDDEPETIKVRLERYYKDTSPLISYYVCAGILKTIDGSQSQEEVSKAVSAILKETQSPINVESSK